MRKLLLFLVLALLASPVLAALPKLEVLLAGIFAPAVPPTMVSEGIECTATANCWNGSTVTCSGGGTCIAVDDNCPTATGHCTHNGAPTYCPPCPPRNCTAGCPGGGTVSCQYNNSCTYVDGCYASCDGFDHWCPNPSPQCQP